MWKHSGLKSHHTSAAENQQSAHGGRGRKVECRGNICLETHGIGCEVSTMLCFGRTEPDREGVGDTEEK